jgi:secreted Zn-dependent insulinase-like peptidase
MAGFFSKKHTNRLRSKQQWRSHDYPTWEGRALGYMVGSHPMVVGSLRLHEIIFNWRKPSSVAEEMASSVSNFDQASIAELKNLTEEDLETS